jgi:hypothetical protein
MSFSPQMRFIDSANLCLDVLTAHQFVVAPEFFASPEARDSRPATQGTSCHARAVRA